MADLIVDPTRKQQLPPAEHSRVDNFGEEEIQEATKGSQRTEEPQKLPREYQEQLPTFLARKGFELYDWITGSSTKQITAMVGESEASEKEECEVTVAKAFKNVLTQKFTECGADKARESLEPFFGEGGKHGKLFKDYGINFLQFVEAMCSTNPNPNLKLEKGLFRDLVYSFLENSREETERVVKSDAPFERKMLELHRLLQLKPQEGESPDFTGLNAFRYCAAFLGPKDIETFKKRSGAKTFENFGEWIGEVEDLWIQERVRSWYDDETILGAILDYQDQFQGHTVVQLLGMLSPETLKIVQENEKAQFSAKRVESSLGDPRAVCGPAMRDYVTTTLVELQPKE